MSFLDKLLGKNKTNPDDTIRMTLRQNGDNGTKPRVVEHLAYFKTMDATQAFMEWVMANGYTLDNSNHEFGVKFVKECVVAGQTFDSELAMLRSKVKGMKGEYDGWGCPVTR
jgi:regulator of RNase E activity RraB